MVEKKWKLDQVGEGEEWRNKWAKWLNILANATYAKTIQHSKEKYENTCRVRYENTARSQRHQTKRLKEVT